MSSQPNRHGYPLFERDNLDNFGRPYSFEPSGPSQNATNARPGSRRKVRILAERYEAGCELQHPHDERIHVAKQDDDLRRQLAAIAARRTPRDDRIPMTVVLTKRKSRYSRRAEGGRHHGPRTRKPASPPDVNESRTRTHHGDA